LILLAFSFLSFPASFHGRRLVCLLGAYWRPGRPPPPASAHLNKTTVDAIHVGERDIYLWDDELAWFGLKITPTGRRVYLIQYRIGGRKGRTRRITFGTHGVLTPHQARQEAKRLLGEVQVGRDPAAPRDRLKRTLTLARAFDRFLTEHVEPKLAPGTAVITGRRGARSTCHKAGAAARSPTSRAASWRAATRRWPPSPIWATTSSACSAAS
jgi:hypothetical protein